MSRITEEKREQDAGEKWVSQILSLRPHRLLPFRRFNPFRISLPIVQSFIDFRDFLDF
jgi:hypothetical protein